MGRSQDSDAPERVEGGVDASALAKTLWARKGSVLLPTTLAAAAALVVVVVIPPRYTAVAKLLLENQETFLSETSAALAQPPNLDDSAVLSAAESLSTPDMARKAIAKLDLDRVAEFHPSAVQRFLDSILAGSRAGKVDDIVVETFLDRLTAFPISHSRVIQIEFSSGDPALAAKGANTLANLYLTAQGAAHSADAQAAAEWLSKRIEPLRAKVADLDAQVESLRAESGLLTGANGLATPSQRLAELTTQVAAARSQVAAANAKAQALRDLVRAGRLEAIADAAHDDSLRRYAEARVALKAQIAEASRTMLSEHPRMREMLGQLAGLDDEIRAAAMKAARGLEDDARIAANQLRDLEAQIRQQSDAVASTDGDAAKLRTLELDAKAAHNQLENYLAKYREASARAIETVSPPNARIIETASPPSTPVFPKRGPTLLLATLAGFVLSLGVAAARALTAHGDEPTSPEPARAPAAPRRRERPEPEAKTVRRPAAAEPIRPAVAEAAKPEVRRAKPRFPGAAPVDLRRSVSDAYLESMNSEAELRRAIDKWVAVAPDGPLMALVTGEGARGGLAAALSAARAVSHRAPTVLVDLGATQPWLADVVERGDGELFGLSDVVAERATLESALRPDLTSRVDILPPGEETVKPHALDSIVERLNGKYPFVILHASDWRSPLARYLLPYVEAVILCGRAARLREMREAVERAVGENKPMISEFPIEKAESGERAA